jgi:type I restriction enzyme R subunit
MIGRGTRLCEDLFGPIRHKEFFYIFDFCQNFEFFNQNPETVDAAAADSLSKKLFVERVELIGEIDSIGSQPADKTAKGIREKRQAFRDEASDEALAAHRHLRSAVSERLQEEVTGMSLDNFLVRPKRKFVEKFAKPKAWDTLSYDARMELIDEVAGLPSSLTDDDTAAKEFDLLILRTQLAVLRADKRLDRLRKTIVETCAILEELTNVPAVAKQLELIQEIQTDEYWQDITAPMLETARKRLRDLIKLIEWKRRPMVYSDFEDEIGDGTEVVLQGANAGTDMAKFKLKARHFLQEHKDHISIRKIHRNERLTGTDLSELERLFLAAGVGDEAAMEKVREDGGLGVFIRSLIGLDREAAKQAFAAFLSDKTLSADQIEFVDMIIDHLTARGVMEPEALYESPFTDMNAMGAEGVLGKDRVAKVIHILRDIRSRAA